MADYGGRRGRGPPGYGGGGRGGRGDFVPRGGRGGDFGSRGDFRGGRGGGRCALQLTQPFAAVASNTCVSPCALCVDEAASHRHSLVYLRQQSPGSLTHRAAGKHPWTIALGRYSIVVPPHAL